MTWETLYMAFEIADTPTLSLEAFTWILNMPLEILDMVFDYLDFPTLYIRNLNLESSHDIKNLRHGPWNSIFSHPVGIKKVPLSSSGLLFGTSATFNGVVSWNSYIPFMIHYCFFL